MFRKVEHEQQRNLKVDHGHVQQLKLTVSSGTGPKSLFQPRLGCHFLPELFFHQSFLLFQVKIHNCFLSISIVSLQDGTFLLSYILGDIWHRKKAHDCIDWYRKVDFWFFSTSQKHDDY
jgi:hypothetical protein